MRIAVTGSIATDHLMRFPGRFKEQLLADQLHNVSLSFLVDELVVRRGGVAANIAYGMGLLGLRPILVGAVGADFAEYQSWLERHNVDCSGVHVSDLAHTARFVCTTDDDMNQIASFYAGAMSEAGQIELGPLATRCGGFELVVVSANDPKAMVRHSAECRDRGVPFVADPSQQLARISGSEARSLVDGAAYLFTNEYEYGLLKQKTGWGDDEIIERVGVHVTTLGREGVALRGKGIDSVQVPVVPERTRVEPTGVGDALRAGFLAGLTWELPLERCLQLGCLMAALVIETTGTQEYVVDVGEAMTRFADAYGVDAADEVRARLTR